MTIIYMLSGFLIGGAIGVYVGLTRGRAGAAQSDAALTELRARLAALDAERQVLQQAAEAARVEKVAAESRLEASREHLADERRRLAEMEATLKTSFEALSVKALDRNSDRFSSMAEERLKPLRDQLKLYEEHLRKLEEKRATAYGDLHQRLHKLDQGRDQLSAETRQLAAALRQPGAKGRWGEVALKNVVERSGPQRHAAPRSDGPAAGRWRAGDRRQGDRVRLYRRRGCDR